LTLTALTEKELALRSRITSDAKGLRNTDSISSSGFETVIVREGSETISTTLEEG
jgi:hypothetical protein